MDLMDKMRLKKEKGAQNELILKRIKDLTTKDTNSKECVECGLKTDFIFTDMRCELCTTKINRTKDLSSRPIIL